LLVAAISSLQSAALKRVSFYKDTTAFVEFLEQSNLTGGIMLTGHSLGGGTFLCFIIHDCVVILWRIDGCFFVRCCAVYTRSLSHRLL